MLDRFASAAVGRRPPVPGPAPVVDAGVSKWASAAARVATSAWAQAALVLVAFGLRLVLLDRYPLREDEAVYGYWALHFWHDDPFFLTVWPDKPPLYLWLLSLVLDLAGPSDAAARWLNIAASTLTVAVIGATARCAWGTKAGLAAGLVAALSPLAISFAPTAYTDPLLVLCGSLALYAAVRRKAIWAGIWLGAAIMTKQQGLLYAPLVLGVLAWTAWCSPGVDEMRNQGRRFRSVGRAALRGLGGAALIMLPVVYWDSLRWHVAPSPWVLSVQHYGALMIVAPGQWPARLAAWAALGWHLTASWFVWVGVLPVLAALAAMRPAPAGAAPRRPHPDHFLVLLLLWAGGFFVLHVVTSVQTWDRYLLPLAPVWALLAGWAAARWTAPFSPRVQAVIAVCAVALLLPPGLHAARGDLPIGGDHGGYAGLREALAGLAAVSDGDAVLYHRTLGWQARFYLYEAMRSGKVELRWFPSVVYLADNAAKTPHLRRLLIEPAWAPERTLSQHLAARRLALQPVIRAGNFTVYEIGARAQMACDWCRCGQEGAHQPALVMFESSAPMTPR